MTTILIAEDNEPFRYTLNRILTKHGYRVLEAAHGEEALEVARKHGGPIHLLCTNVDMPPGMDGIELARRFRVERPETKLLYVTAGTRPEFSLLQKPFTEEELVRKVRELLESPPFQKAAESGK